MLELALADEDVDEEEVVEEELELELDEDVELVGDDEVEGKHCESAGGYRGQYTRETSQPQGTSRGAYKSRSSTCRSILTRSTSARTSRFRHTVRTRAEYQSTKSETASPTSSCSY